jgi:nucleotide-binding universal stress UspA family protein
MKLTSRKFTSKKLTSGKLARPANRVARGKRGKSALLLADDMAAGEGEKRDQRSLVLRAVASRLADKLVAHVDLVHVEDNSFYPARDPRLALLFERYTREREGELSAGAGQITGSAHSILLRGNPATEILRLAAKRGAYELVVVGTQGRKGVERLLVGSVAEEVIRNSPIPVMTVGPLAREESEGFLSGKKLRIFLPTSLTKNSDRAEAYALSLAARLEAELVYFHSLYEGLHPLLQSVYSLPSSSRDLGSLLDDLKSRAAKALEKRMAGARRKKVAAECVLDDGYNHADAAILREAEKAGAGLVVMGTHGRSFLGGAFFGRTARGVVLRSRVPVITVRSRGA